MRRLAGGLLLAVALAGCADLSPRSWYYAPDPRTATDPLANVSVIVLPFEDRRLNENSDFTGMSLLPLVPFVWMTYYTPEGVGHHMHSTLWQFQPAEDFRRAVAQEVDNARIFRETSVGNTASDADYVLLGEIASTTYKGKVLTYGLSLGFAPWFWFVGLPNTTTSNELILTLKLAKTPSAPAIWTYTIRMETTAVVLSPHVLEAVLDRALELERSPEQPDRRAALADELARLEREIGRYTEAVAQGGSLPSILAALRAREHRRQELQAQLEHQEGLGLAVRAFDQKAVRQELRDLLPDWQGLLEGEPAQARQILRKLLEGRLMMTPRVDSTGRFYDWTATATYGRILTGVVGVTSMVPPG